MFFFGIILTSNSILYGVISEFLFQPTNQQWAY